MTGQSSELEMLLDDVFPHIKCKPDCELCAAKRRLLPLLEAGQAGYHALRSYEYGNSATELARECAAGYEIALAAAKGETK